MIVLAQVAAEYGTLTSSQGTLAAWTNSFRHALDRITSVLSTQYVVIGLGVLLVLYLGKKLLRAF